MNVRESLIELCLGKRIRVLRSSRYNDVACPIGSCGMILCEFEIEGWHEVGIEFEVQLDIGGDVGIFGFEELEFEV